MEPSGERIMNKKIFLYLVTGFLGSGKTTFIKNLLSDMKNKKVAVVINEFGSNGVDGVLLTPSAFTITEINEGSVFCTCKADAFIDAIWALSKKDIDIILVETSGMSDPSSMPSILEVIRKKTEKIIYRGCITIASATNINKLLRTSLFVQGQVKEADILILNKTDLAAPEQISLCEETIRHFNPHCTILKTSYCDIPQIESLLSIEHSFAAINKAEYQTEGSSATKRLTLTFNHPVDQEHLLQFLQKFQHDLYRVKGFILLNNGTTTIVDGVTDSIKLKQAANLPITDFFLVLIYPNDKPLRHLIQKGYREIFQKDPVLAD